MSEAFDKIDAAIAYARRVADHESLSGKTLDFWGSLGNVLKHLSGEPMPEPEEVPADPVPVADLSMDDAEEASQPE